MGPFPNESESEPNSALDEAQIIPLNVTVNGVAQNEDVDYFEINATQGQRISAEVEAIRLSGPLFDPYVAILDENRFEIATSDDSELLLQDSTTSDCTENRKVLHRGQRIFLSRERLLSLPVACWLLPSSISCNSCRWRGGQAN